MWEGGEAVSKVDLLPANVGVPFEECSYTFDSPEINMPLTGRVTVQCRL